MQNLDQQSQPPDPPFTRREMLARSGTGFGMLALSGLVAADEAQAQSPGGLQVNVRRRLPLCDLVTGHDHVEPMTDACPSQRDVGVVGFARRGDCGWQLVSSDNIQDFQQSRFESDTDTLHFVAPEAGP